MNNPLPVDPFSVAEAARRTWPALIESLLEAVCLVEPEGLRIVAANGAAGRLFGVAPAELVGRDMRATASTAEDEAFWDRVAAKGGAAQLLSESFVARFDGEAVPVLRRVSRVEPAPGNALWIVALVDRSESVRAESALATSVAELAATLESMADAVLVVDLAGNIRNFNRRFAALWDLPEEMLVLHADDAVFDWLRGRVESPAEYERRLAEIERDPALRATDTLRLRSGALLERTTAPQLARGRPIGRVFTYRIVAAGAD